VTQGGGSAAAASGEPGEASESDEDSETDGDEGEAICRRLAVRPRTPVLKVARAAVADACNLAWIGDSGGWIWCIDLAASAAEAESQQQAGKELPSGHRHSAAAGTRQRLGTRNRWLAQPPKDEAALPKPRPDLLKVVGAWPAHLGSVASLVSAGSPPALVSMDSAKEVKVWSTAGDLWGHFSTIPSEGVPPTVAVWPPPHVLAAQVVLMRSAKDLCRRMGFDKLVHKATNAPETPAQGAPRGKAARLALDEAGGARDGDATSPMAALGGTDRDGAFFPMSPTSTAAATPAAPGRPAADADGAASAKLSCAQPFDPSLSVVTDGSFVESADEEEALEQLEAAALPGVPPRAAMSPSHPSVSSFRSVASDAEAGGAAGAAQALRGREDSKLFTSNQMSEMIRNKAFSSGCRSYTQFVRRGDKRRAIPKSESLTQLERTRNASNFGVELFTNKECRAWEASRHRMGHSASEGALLRFAMQAADDMTKSVKENLGVDVTTVSRREMNKPSFIARLDINGVASSVTAQAAKKATMRDSSQRVSLPSLRDSPEPSVSSRDGSGRLQRSKTPSKP